MPSPSTTRDPFSGLELLSEDTNLSLGSMEAVDWTPPAATTAAEPSKLGGICLATGVTCLAILTHVWLLKPFGIPFGPSVIAMIYGIVIANLFHLPDKIFSGLHWIVSRLIPIAIVALGAGLDLSVLASNGWTFLGLVVLAVVVSLGAASIFGKWLGLSKEATLLVGAGSAICGSSAILAIAPLLKAKKENIIASVAAINIIGLLAMIICIVVGLVFPIAASDFGQWCGSTIHAVPTVAGAAFDHSAEAGEIATLIKLGRVAMLAPLVIALAIWTRPKENANSTAARGGRKLGNPLRLVPWFVIGFVVAALLKTFQLMPTLNFSSDSALIDQPLSVNAANSIQWLGKLLLTLAMAAIGLQVGLRSMLKTGRTAVLATLFTWIVLSAILLTVILLVP
jgi:uncharacterized integral membrane protein (TIGR00698 family)